MSNENGDKPTLRQSRDGLYFRCVWCGHENWMLAVGAYSRGDIPCAAAPGCGRFLPQSYVKLPPGGSE